MNWASAQILGGENQTGKFAIAEKLSCGADSHSTHGAATTPPPHPLQSIEKSNTMKRRLNTYQQVHRINPDSIKAVSDNEPKDLMPDVSNFLDLP